MRVLLRRAYSGWGYLASVVGGPGEVPHGEAVHGVGFDEALVELASKQPPLQRPDGAPLTLADLTVTLVSEQYGQYLLEVTPR